MSDNHVIEITGTVIGAVTALSNIIEIIILLRKGKERTKADDIILSLSCADMLVGIVYLGTSSYILAVGMQDADIIKLITGILHILCFNTSVLHILTIAVERFYAVRYPIKYRLVITKKITRRTITGMWALSMTVVACFAIPDILQSTNILGVYKGIFILVSGIVVVLCYGYLGYVIWHRGKFIASSTARDETSHTRGQKQLRDTIFSYAIATTYIICSFPFAIELVLRVKDFRITELIIVVNSLIDPILYFWKGNYEKCQRGNRSKGINQENQAAATVNIMM